MKTKILLLVLATVISFVSCDDSFENLNKNQNNLTTDVAVPGNLLIKGTMLADVAINASHLQRISAMWSGQYKGEILLYNALYNYNISTEESNSAWGYLYNGIIKQNRLIEKSLAIEPKSRQLLMGGITKIIEANAVGTATSIWGDIPYSEAVTNTDNPEFDPKFDKQADVYKAIQIKLDEAITQLTTSGVATALPEDIFFAGDPAKWVKVAYTLKARYYLQTKQYGLAYNAALKGISSNSETLKFMPITATGGENLLYRFMRGRAGYMTTNTNVYLSELLGTGFSNSRRNSKTNETARNKFYKATRYASGNKNIAGETTSMYLVSFQENLSILAECGARTVSFDKGLEHLNSLRALLASGTLFYVNGALQYDAYRASDFTPNTGMENSAPLAVLTNPTRALLREIIEERYVLGVGTFIPFNDARRLRKSDSDIAVPFPLNNTSVTKYPERFPYSQNAINANSNTPKNVDIYTVTPVNQ